MNDTQVTKGKIGRLIAKNLIVMLVAVIVALTGVLAWFVQNNYADANGVIVQTKAYDGIEIAVVGHGEQKPAGTDYKNEFTLSKADYPFMSQLNITEVTGDGLNNNFLKPPIKLENGKAFVDLDADWSRSAAKENQNYLSFDLYIRSKAPQKICLASDSSIEPKSTKLSWANGDDAPANLNPSPYGPYSKDCVVGSVRFAVVSPDNTRQLLWIPAPNIRLSDDTTTVATNLTEGDTYTHYYYDKDKVRNSLSNSAVVANNNKDYTLGTNKEIIELKDQEEMIVDEDTSEKFYVNHIVCNLWIEGEDEESRLALVGGEYMVNLLLKIIE